MIALTKEGRSLEALDSLITHAARAMQHGFTEGELQRARRDVQTVYNDYLTEASNRKNREYVEEYIDHYMNGGYIPGVVAESKMLIDQLGKITLDEVNDYLREVIGKDNVSVLISGPQTLVGASRYPTSRDVISHFNRIMSTPQVPYIDQGASDKLLDQEPKPGGVISENYDPETIGLKEDDP